MCTSMLSDTDSDFENQQRRIADVKAAIKREKAMLDQAPLLCSSCSPSDSNPGSTTSSTNTSRSNAIHREPSPSAQPLTWTRVQERMRVLHAWEAKCTVEEAAVRELETDVQRDMAASMGRKAALMEQLQSISHEEAALKSMEALLSNDVAALSSKRAKIKELCNASEQRLQHTRHSNHERRQQLKDAQLEFERRNAARAKELQAMKDDVAEAGARATETELAISATVQRISDQERRIHLVEVSMREREQARIDSVKREISRLLLQLEAEGS